MVAQNNDYSRTLPILLCFCISVLTLAVGTGVLIVVVVMDCIRSFALDLRGIRVPGTGTLNSAMSTPSPAGDGKNWLWKLFFSNSALSLASQFCVVKWHWEEPQVVGNTMSFTVKVMWEESGTYNACTMYVYSGEILILFVGNNSLLQNIKPQKL